MFHVLYVCGDFLVCIHSKLKDYRYKYNEQQLFFIMSSESAKEGNVTSQYNNTLYCLPITDMCNCYGRAFYKF